MALVHHQEEILREKIDQAEGTLAGLPPGEVAGVVLDAAAESHLLQHLEVVVGPHPDALGLEELLVLLKERHALLELGLRLCRIRHHAAQLQHPERLLAETDALVVLKDGRIAVETYANGTTATTSHIIMSASKSITGLIAAGVCWWIWRERRGTQRAAIPFADLDLVAVAMPSRRRWVKWLPGALLVLALAGFTVALARPQAVTDVPRDQGSIMLAVDVSGFALDAPLPPLPTDVVVHSRSALLIRLSRERGEEECEGEKRVGGLF